MLYKSGEREIIYTNSHSQYHHSIEEVDIISYTIIMLAVVSLVIFWLQLLNRIKSIAGFDIEDEDERPVSGLLLLYIPSLL